MIPSQRHEAARPSGKQTKGFAAALRAHCGVRLGRYPFVPDAFEFDTEQCRLTLYEVYVTHAMDERKLGKLRSLRLILIDLGWSLHLLIGSSDGVYGRFDIETGECFPEDLRAAILRLDPANRLGALKPCP